MRSFENVDDKVYETDFFLEAIKSCNNFIKCKYYFSAFLSASRSITFVLQACMKDVTGFDSWYKSKQLLLKDNDLAKYFVDARNESQKEGSAHIVGANHSIEDEQWLFFLNKDCTPYTLIASISKKDHGTDVYSRCREYFCLLLEIIYECYIYFKYTIDPFFYYSVKGMKYNQLAIEDIEESLGYPRGWTSLDLCSENDRIILIRNSQPMSTINEIFKKYLHKSIRYIDC